MKRHAGILKQMQDRLTAELKRFPNRPFGEFVPGGNAISGGYADVFQTLTKTAAEKKKKR